MQATAEQAMREFAYRQGCTEMHTPKLMGTASESGAEVFELGYFGRSAYLAQSRSSSSKWRSRPGSTGSSRSARCSAAEPSFTSRHATEFTGVDVELAWIDDVEDVMAFEERMLAHLLAAVASRHGEAIRELLGVAVVVPELPFPRITMAQARALAEAHGAGGRGDADDRGDLTRRASGLSAPPSRPAPGTSSRS